jgi:thiamine pyrophosphate-dependent acetolactate synthase large subunit-like protein
MTGEAQCKPIGLSSFAEQGRAAEASLREAARLINSAKAPVVFLGLMASKPNAADAIRAFLNACSIPVVGTTGLRIDRPDQITTTLRKAFDTPGPVLVGVHVDYRQNVKLFEQVYEGSIL